MFAVFYEEKLVTIFMMLSLLLSVFTRIMIGILYQNMIKQTENMSTTNHKALKQCKMKFTNCYQLNNGVSNISIFVDKFLNRLKVGPFSYQTIYHLSGQLMLLSVFFAGVGVCKSIIAGFNLGGILPFYIFSFLGLYFYFAISAIADIRGRRRVLKTNLVDYLENHMVKRLEQAGEEIPENQDKEINAAAKRRQNAREKAGLELMPVHAINPITDKSREPETEVRMSHISISEERELEELLREFLTS